MARKDNCLKVIRMSNAERRDVLARLDETEAAHVGANRRRAPRLSFRRTHVKIQITQPEGMTVECTVPTRDLSAGGFSFVYWGFLYPKTVCQCELAQPDGRVHQYQGEVAWCRHLAGQNHLVGVRFRETIPAELFIDGPPVPAEQIDPRHLHGRVLVISADRIARRLLEVHLGRTSLQYACVATASEAMQACAAQAVDLVLCDMDGGSMVATQLLVALRMIGTQARFVGMTAETDPQRQRQMREAGARDLLIKPLTEQAVMDVLKVSLWHGQMAHDPSNAVVSQVEGTGIDDVIAEFVEAAQQAAGELQEAWIAGDVARMRSLAMTLRGTAAGVGFPQVGDMAGELVAAVDGEGAATSEKAAGWVRRLCALCGRLACPRASAA